jgi:hypothetical protein
MQVGGKGNEAGWSVYEESRLGGAIIATAHEHSYSRTHLLQKMSYPIVASRDSNMILRKGRSFVFVAGLGGSEVRPQLRNGDWWASIYTATQSAKAGALFATFHVDGNPRKAFFQFKNIDGKVIDKFEVFSEVDAPLPAPPPEIPPRPLLPRTLLLDPKALGVAPGGRVKLQDVSGRTLKTIPSLNQVMRITLNVQGLIFLSIENPVRSGTTRKVILLP